jgi:hypothetical protein
MQTLRTTPLDPSGRAKVRRFDRAPVEEYRSMIRDPLDGSAVANHSMAVLLPHSPT